MTALVARLVALSANFKIGKLTPDAARGLIAAGPRRLVCPLWYIWNAAGCAERRPNPARGNVAVYSDGYLFRTLERFAGGTAYPGEPPEPEDLEPWLPEDHRAPAAAAAAAAATPGPGAGRGRGAGAPRARAGGSAGVGPSLGLAEGARPRGQPGRRSGSASPGRGWPRRVARPSGPRSRPSTPTCRPARSSWRAWTGCSGGRAASRDRPPGPDRSRFPVEGIAMARRPQARETLSYRYLRPPGLPPGST